jgi:type I restriction enzyme S subunit
MELRAGYKQTEIGVIPEDWEVRPFTRTLHIGSGQVDPRRDEFRDMILVAPDHLVENTGCLISRVTASDQRAKSGKYRFFAGDIVYSKIRPYLNKVMLAQFDGLCSADMYPLSASAGAEGAFCFYSLLSKRFVSFASTVSVRNAIPKINREELAQFSFALPPLPEQRAISAALSDADALIASLDALIAKKRDLKLAAMQQLLTGKTRLPGFTREWDLKRLGELGVTYGGLTGKSKADFGHGVGRYIPFLNIMANVVIDPIDLELVDVSANEKQNLAQEGDLFFNGSSETPEEVGMCSLLSCELDNLYLNSFCFGFRLRDKNAAHGLYLAYFFRSQRGRELFAALAQGATRYNLSKRALMAVSFRCPSPTEQVAIAEVMIDMDSALTALEAKRDKARALKQGMMQALLTGRIRLV